jgi:hypothetical protein
MLKHIVEVKKLDERPRDSPNQDHILRPDVFLVER